LIACLLSAEVRTDAQLDGAKLIGARLDGAKLTGADLHGAILTEAGADSGSTQAS
jgi:uncharacterized protein YjbI with pentapeptide repeats